MPIIIFSVWEKLIQYSHAIAGIHNPKQLIPGIPDSSHMPGRNISGSANQTEGFHVDDLDCLPYARKPVSPQARSPKITVARFT
jgi:hypothetical protein